MDISSELDRLLPASLEESTLSKIVDEFLLFLHRLTKGEYESVLTLLPDSPSFNSLPITAQSWGDSSTGLTTSTPKDSFVDLICYYSIQFYAATHVPPIEVIWHLLKRIRGRKPGNGLRRLAKMMSRREREGLFEELIALDLNDKESYGIVDEFVDYLESLFKGDRPGMIDIALEELLKQYEKKRTSPKYLVKDHLEEYILKKIQANRRNDPNRLPAKIKNVREARFVVEEVHRELIVYSTTDKAKAIELLWRVLDWYDVSELRNRILGRVEFFTEAGFFDQLRNTARYLTAQARYKETWEYYIVGWLEDETFWDNLGGLNKDIPFEHTEAARRQAAYRRSVVLGPAILMAPIVLPALILLAIRSPGAVIKLFRWTQGRLLLATQYANSTIAAYGAAAGTAKIAGDVYTYYLSNAIAMNQIIVNGTEVVLDFSDSGTGLSPGSSPADLFSAASATQKMAKLTSKGISELAEEAKTLAQGHEVGVELIEFVASSEGKLYKVTALITGAEEGKIKTVVREITPLVDNFNSQKTIKFFSEPQNDSAIIRDTQGTKATGAAMTGADDAKVGAKTTDNTSVTASSKATVDNGLSKDQAKGVWPRRRKISAGGVGLTADERYARLKQPKVMEGYLDRYGDTRQEVKDLDPRVLEEARRIRAEELPDLSVKSFGRNVAVVRVKIDGQEKIIGSINDPGSVHSEEQILKSIEKEVGPLELPRNRKRVELMEVYSERQPCGERCSKLLKDYFPDAKVYYTVSESWTEMRAKELMDRWLGTASVTTSP